MCPEVEARTDCQKREDQELEHKSCLGASPLTPEQSAQTDQSHHPDRPSRTDHVRRGIDQQMPAVMEAHNRSVFASVSKRPEPEVSKDTSAPQNQASQCERQHHTYPIS